MISKQEEWSMRIDEITKGFNLEFGKLSLTSLNWKPSNFEWSIAQNIEHIIVSNQSYLNALRDMKSGSYNLPNIAKSEFFVSFFGGAQRNASKPGRRRKTKTIVAWEPSQGPIEGDILYRFLIHNCELKKEIISSKYWIEKGVVIVNPANKNVVYRLEAAFDILVNHEQRHLEQAREVLILLNRGGQKRLRLG